MRNKSFTAIVLFFFLIPACSHNKNVKILHENEIQIQIYNEINKIQCPTNSLPITEGVNQISLNNNQFYISINDINKIFKLNSNLELIEIIDTPCEAESFYIFKENLYINAYLTGLKEIINKNKIKNITASNNPEIVTHLQYFIKDSIFYFYDNIKNNTNTITSYNFKNKEIKKFGKYNTSIDNVNFRFGNSRHVLNINNKIISIGKFVPTIEKYNFDGILENTYDLKQIPIIDNLFDENNFKKKILPIIINDCCFNKNKLYLLINSKNNSENKNIILTFYTENEIVLDKMCILKNSINITDFCCKGDSLITFDYSLKQLKVFLPEV